MINQFDPKHRQTLSEIQGNILKAHGRNHTANIFIVGKPNRSAQVKQWFRELVDANTGIIKSGYEYLYANNLFKTKGIDGGLFACLHISYDGYKYLFDENMVKQKFGDVSSFGLGMKKASLQDPDVNQWDEGYQDEIHFHLLIGDKIRWNVDAKVESIKNEIKDFADVQHVENGDAIKNAEGAGLEHFGYVDGVSQPLFFEEEMDTFLEKHGVEEAKGLKYNPSANLNQVLVQDPFEPSAQGSFFVFRKLEQNVNGFKKAEEHLADELGLKGEDKERAGAMIVGRFEDGTPVEVSGEPGLINNSSFNNFNYKIDDASKCPYHAHIRKTNPRDDIADAKDAVMARRGIPYGKRTDDMFDGDANTKPTRGVGLLFQSYQASIEKQFERIQKFWANNEGFVKDEVGLDLIIGQGNYPSINEYQATWGGKAQPKKESFDKFVTMKGGEYFFSPSIVFLQNIK